MVRTVLTELNNSFQHSTIKYAESDEYQEKKERNTRTGEMDEKAEKRLGTEMQQ